MRTFPRLDSGTFSGRYFRTRDRLASRQAELIIRFPAFPFDGHFDGVNTMADEISVVVVKRKGLNLYLRYVDPIDGKRREKNSGTKASGRWWHTRKEARLLGEAGLLLVNRFLPLA
ncbi:MAG TPA: hypothetical protein PLY87_25330 [Planctomycetaceae bacterium]|nr:hypothetical protein [Planctomycetaceae bacterium]